MPGKRIDGHPRRDVTIEIDLDAATKLAEEDEGGDVDEEADEGSARRRHPTSRDLPS